MSNKFEGGYAFPYQLDNPEQNVKSRGMTYREWLAGLAMLGLLQGKNSTDRTSNTLIARRSFEIADAMIERGHKKT